MAHRSGSVPSKWGKGFKKFKHNFNVVFRYEESAKIHICWGLNHNEINQ